MTPDADPTIGVLGLGHVGLPTALGLAELGWTVLGADDDADKARQIAQGETVFYEAGMAESLREHLRTGRFRVSSDVAAAVKGSDVLFVCVGTPQRGDGSADLSQVDGVARTIAGNLNGYKLIVEKSTTPVRTAEQLKRTVSRYSHGSHDVDIAVNPEFLREGTAMADFMNPDRIVIGVESDRARDLLLRIYEPLMDGCAPRRAVQSGGPTSDRPQSTSGHQLVVTNLNTAELIKHASNAFLAMKVSFINMVADLCEAADADVDQVAKGLGMDPRIGDRFLQAGIGFGGYCLPKDLRAFRRIGEEHGVDMTLVKATSDINETRAERLVSKVRKALWVLEGKRLAVWGLAFKPGTDDVREAPSEAVVRGLLAEGAILQLHDPQAMHTFRQLFVEEVAALVYCDSAMEAVSGADALLVLTEWPEYLDVDLAQVREEMAVPVIIDGRNHLDPVRVRRLGFEYHGMGR